MQGCYAIARVEFIYVGRFDVAIGLQCTPITMSDVLISVCALPFLVTGEWIVRTVGFIREEMLSKAFLKKRSEQD